MVKLKVFAGKTFESCEHDFNHWMEANAGIVIVNISFNNGEAWREITVLWAQPEENPKISIPQLHIAGKPQ